MHDKNHMYMEISLFDRGLLLSSPYMNGFHLHIQEPSIHTPSLAFPRIILFLTISFMCLAFITRIIR